MASAAFDSMIEALDIAYDVKDNRPFWKTAISRCGDQWRPALGHARCDGSRPELGRMAGSSTRALNRIRYGVAITSLDIAISFTVVVVELLGTRAKLCQFPHSVRAY